MTTGKINQITIGILADSHKTLRSKSEDPLLREQKTNQFSDNAANLRQLVNEPNFARPNALRRRDVLTEQLESSTRTGRRRPQAEATPSFAGARIEPKVFADSRLPYTLYTETQSAKSDRTANRKPNGQLQFFTFQSIFTLHIPKCEMKSEEKYLVKLLNTSMNIASHCTMH